MSIKYPDLLRAIFDDIDCITIRQFWPKVTILVKFVTSLPSHTSELQIEYATVPTILIAITIYTSQYSSICLFFPTINRKMSKSYLNDRRRKDYHNNQVGVNFEVRTSVHLSQSHSHPQVSWLYLIPDVQ